MISNSKYPAPNVMKTISYTVGKRIAYYRQKQNISQEELGRRIGLEAYQIYEFENGLHKINLEVLFEFAYALHVPAFDLIMSEEDV